MFTRKRSCISTSDERRNQAFYTTDCPNRSCSTQFSKRHKLSVYEWSKKIRVGFQGCEVFSNQILFRTLYRVHFINQFATSSCITESVSARKVWVNGWDKTINRRLHKSFSWYGSQAQLPPLTTYGPMRWEGGAWASARVSAVTGVSYQTWADTATWPRWTATTPRATITMAPHSCTTYTTRLKVTTVTLLTV